MSDNLWTDAEVAQLIEMRAGGWSFSEIGRHLGRSKNSCISRARRSNIATGGRTKYRKAYSKNPTQKIPVSEAGVHLLDAGGNHCRFPLWDDNGPASLNVCGQPGYPWCPKHRAVVFTKKSEREANRNETEAVA